MPNLLWWVPLVSGFHDGINPCVLITASYSLLVLVWFKKIGLRKVWLLFFFIPLFITAFVINCGLLDQYIFNKKFIQVIKYIYVALGLVLAFYGIKFFNEWLKLVKGKSVEESQSVVVTKKPSAVLIVMLVLAACILSLLASLWPINYYVSVASVYMAVPGQFWIMGSIVFFYTWISLWLVAFVFWLEGTSNKNSRFFKIVSAAVLLAGSIGVIDLFL